MIKETIDNSTLAFRGYNVTNLGRTPELLQHKAYGPVIEPFLREASEVCAEVVGRPVDLVQRVRDQQETDLASYADAIALIVAMEQAQLELLRQFHDVDYKDARMSYGFSLGEISALIAGGVFAMKDALTVPLAMAEDCALLAEDVTLGILFSRSKELPLDQIFRLCMEINLEADGVIGVSSYLSPNSLLIMGTGSTMDKLRKRKSKIAKKGIHLRRNEHKWPPLHTPIVWQKNVPNRSSQMMHTLPGGFQTPDPNVLSLVTGDFSYTDVTAREIVGLWVDHTQRLWDAVLKTLSLGIETVIHIGPAPNIIPATFQRLSGNIESQTKDSRRLRALSAVASRTWLSSILPQRAALLRATSLNHIVLEDWLLEQDV